MADPTTPPTGSEPLRPPRVSPRSFARIPTVRTADEIVDTAFKRASRITVPSNDAFQKMKATEIARVRSVQNTVVHALQTTVKRFPSFDGLPLFYQELMDILVDMDRTRKSLGAIDWASKRVTEVGDEAAKNIKRARFGEEVHPHKQHAYGRVASLLNQVNKDLVYLDEVRRNLKRLPVIEHDVPTIVVAGYPNVGKSSLVRSVSTGTPEVASYPFTTKGIILGHFERNHVKHQIVDTPGLLDRDLDARNAIERQAISALRHLADVIVFLVDPSEHCGYSLDAQRKLLADTRATFPDTPFVIGASKSDLPEAKRGVPEADVAFSVEKQDGVDELMRLAFARMRKREYAHA